MNPRRMDALRGSAARTHADADPAPKRTAALVGVTDRTARRWRTPEDAKGAPNYRLALYLDSTPHPERLLSYVRALLAKAVADLTSAELTAQIRERYTLDAHLEAEDNASRTTLGLGALDRAAVHERDAANDEWLAAAWRECAARGLTDVQVLGS